MQHIEIPVHPNHTIDNNYACTHIEKNTHCQLNACWEKNDWYTFDMISWQSTYVVINYIQMVSLQIHNMFLDQYGITS